MKRNLIRAISMVVLILSIWAIWYAAGQLIQANTDNYPVQENIWSK